MLCYVHDDKYMFYPLTKPKKIILAKERLLFLNCNTQPDFTIICLCRVKYVSYVKKYIVFLHFELKKWSFQFLLFTFQN